MPQDRDSGRNASLDDKKVRAAARTENPARGELPAGEDLAPGQHLAGGAFGNPGDEASLEQNSQSRGAGGGGGAQSMPDEMEENDQRP